MPRSLADGKTKFTILTEEPTDAAAPTAAELNAGIDLSCSVLASDFVWGAADSDKVAEKALCVENNANALGASNFQGGFTLFRYFDPETGAPDDDAEDGFAAVKVRGATLWAYARRTGKKASEVWATGDEIFFGAEVITDNLQPPSDLGGYIKYRVPLEIQAGYPFIAVAAGGGGGGGGGA